jgi:hypothetical protein
MKLSQRLTIRITPTEKALLEGRAEMFKISPSEFVRIAAFNYNQPPVMLSVTDSNTYELLGKLKLELNRIGKNVNQIAHNTNLSTMMGSLSSPVQAELDELQKISEFLEKITSQLLEIKALIKFKLESNDRENN